MTADLATHQVRTPVVVLLGGSSGREATIGDSSWRYQIRREGGPFVVARNLSSRNQSFAQDLQLVRGLPREPTLVFIGVNLYRFCASPDLEFVRDVEPYSRRPQHVYSAAHVKSAAEKEQLAAEWMPQLYPKFDERFDYNMGVLEEVVKTSLERGFRPVILDLPRNVEVIGDRHDLAVERYSRASQALAARYDVPFIGFVTGLGLVSSDFYDIAHLVEPGQAKYQRRLSQTSVDLLKEYGMTATRRKQRKAPEVKLSPWVVSPWTAVPVFLPDGLEPKS